MAEQNERVVALMSELREAELGRDSARARELRAKLAALGMRGAPPVQRAQRRVVGERERR